MIKLFFKMQRKVDRSLLKGNIPGVNWLIKPVNAEIYFSRHNPMSLVYPLTEIVK